MAQPDLRPEIGRLVTKWRRTPATFVTDSFAGVEPDPWQVEALQALADSGRVSIRACHGPGKSAVDAWAILWFLSCHFPAKVPCTAPTSHQLEDILWAELAKWLGKMPAWHQSLFRMTGERLEWVAAPKESFAVARTARKEQPEALQGFHGDHLLFVLDEASGIDEKIFEVAEGALSGEGAKVLMTANPTRTSGYFFDSHHKMRHRWHSMRISHEDSPRVSRQYVEDVAAKWGPESNVYRVRVDGEFPRSDDDAVIPLEWIESARSRDVRPHGDIVWGLDVARFGRDDSALAKACANALLEPVHRWHGYDTMQVAGAAMEQYESTPTERLPSWIYVDVIGIGAGVVDRLKELLRDTSTKVVGVNVAEGSSNKQRYMRLRDELWFRGREFFEDKDCSFADDEETIAELASVKAHPPTSTGKLRVFTKDEMRDEGMQSPDGADAFLLTRHHRWNARRQHEPIAGRGYKRQVRRQVRRIAGIA